MDGPIRERIIVRHFGSRVGVAGGGGVASVIATHADLPYVVVRPVFVTTSHLGARLYSGQHVPGAVVALARAVRKAPRSVAHVHLAGGGSLVREGGIVRIARRLGVPTVVTVHASDLADAARDHSARLRAVLRAAHVVHALGASSARILHDVGGADLVVVVIPNCVIAPTQVTDAGGNPPVALFAGEQSLRKGLDVLIAAWPSVRAAVPDARLVIAGNERDFSVPPTAGVEVIGPVRREHVADALQHCRVAVLPSRMEAQPMFLLEAMATARPVVATAIAEIPGTLADHTGLVAPDDPEALARALIVFLGDADRATRSGNDERDHVMRTHAPAQIARAFEAAYELALRSASQPSDRTGQSSNGA